MQTQVIKPKFKIRYSAYDNRPQAISLLRNIKKNMKVLEELYKRDGEDEFYRYYHYSFKVYWLQETTTKIIKTFKKLSRRPLNPSFLKIVSEGTGKVFEHSHNEEWDKHTRPILEAFFHTRHFLKQIIKYGKELRKPPSCLPSGWAAVLYLFNLR